MIEHQVSTEQGPIHVNEYPGEGPAVVMTHGFPVTDPVNGIQP